MFVLTHMVTRHKCVHSVGLQVIVENASDEQSADKSSGSTTEGFPSDSYFSRKGGVVGLKSEFGHICRRRFPILFLFFTSVV